MKLILLTVLFTVMQAVQPVPRKAHNQIVHGSGDVQRDSIGNKGVLDSTSEAKGTSSNENKGDNQSDANKPVIVIEPVSSPKKDYWDKAYVILTGLLVLVGGCGIRYAIKTLKAIERQGLSMRRQTTHLKNSVIMARRSAQAAKDSADALVNGERPWIVPDISVEFPPSITFLGGESYKTAKAAHFSFTLTLKNYGRSPAKIVSLRDIPRTVKSEQELPEIPEYITGLQPSYANEKILVPNQPWECSNFDVKAIVTDDQAKEIANGREIFIFFGRVQYTDFFNPQTIHETRFCYFYRYRIYKFVWEGPSEYTKYT